MLIFISCRNEHDFYDENGDKITTKNVNFDEFKNKINLQKDGMLFERIDELKKKGSLKRLTQNNFIQTIHTNEITYFELENGTISYTMRVTTNIPNDNAITNIVYFSLNDNELDFKVIRYFPTQNWLNQITTNNNALFEGTLEGYNSDEINLTNTNFQSRRADQCPIGLEPIWLCSNGNNHAPHAFGCIADSHSVIGFTTIWGDCAIGGGGGGGVTGGNSPNTDREFIPTKPITLSPIIESPCKQLRNSLKPENENVKKIVDSLKNYLNSPNERSVSTQKSQVNL